MFMTDKPATQWGSLLAACMIGLTGCANFPAAQEDPNSANSISSQTGAQAAQKAGMQQKPGANNALAERQPDYATMNPVPITFDKMSVKLDEGDKTILQKISERAKNADKLVITGYCDRHQVGNAKAAAIARATAVRNELVELGVAAKNIRIKYVTETADKHAVDIEF